MLLATVLALAFTTPSPRLLSRARCSRLQIFASADNEQTEQKLEEKSAAWNAVLQGLNAAPVFALANQEGVPIQQRERDGQPLVLLFAAIDRAQDELEAARKASPDLELQLLPVGLGVAYAQLLEGKAVIVPGFAELSEAQDMQLAADEMPAGMLEGAGIDIPVVQWDENVLPLFGCFEMVRRRPDGSRFTPVFMSHKDAQAAFDKARAANPERTAKFAVEVVPLPELVELAAAGKAKVPPRVIPPSESMLYLQQRSSGKRGADSRDESNSH